MSVGLSKSSSSHQQGLLLPVPNLEAVPTRALDPAKWENTVPASTTTASLVPSLAASLLPRAVLMPAPASQRRTTGVRSMSLVREDAFKIGLPKGSFVSHMSRYITHQSVMTNGWQARRPRTRKRAKIET